MEAINSASTIRLNRRLKTQWKKILFLVFCLMEIFARDAEAVDRKIVNGRPGDRINVPCNAPHHNANEIKWFKGDQLKVHWGKERDDVIYPNEEDRNKYTIEISYELIIDKADISDSGIYTCRYLNEENSLPEDNWKEVKVWAYCDPPRLPDHATYNPKSDEYGEGSVVTCSCNEGYTLSGNITIKCMPSGHGSSWSEETQMCLKDSFPLWAWIAIGAAVLVIMLCLLLACWKSKRRKRHKGKRNDVDLPAAVGLVQKEELTQRKPCETQSSIVKREDTGTCLSRGPLLQTNLKSTTGASQNPTRAVGLFQNVELTQRKPCETQSSIAKREDTGISRVPLLQTNLKSTTGASKNPTRDAYANRSVPAIDIPKMKTHWEQKGIIRSPDIAKKVENYFPKKA